MNSDDPADLLAAVRGVRDRVVAEGERIRGRWDSAIVRSSFHASAANMAHFLAYRRIDLRPSGGVRSTASTRPSGRAFSIVPEIRPSRIERPWAAIVERRSARTQTCGKRAISCASASAF